MVESLIAVYTYKWFFTCSRMTDGKWAAYRIRAPTNKWWVIKPGETPAAYRKEPINASKKWARFECIR